MKLIKLASIIFATAVFTACDGNSGNGGYAIKKTTDWEKLNLKDSVEEFIEQEGYFTRYTTFNKQGYIVEKGWYSHDTKQVKERCEYDAGNNLVKAIKAQENSYIEPDRYRTFLYDEMGRLIQYLSLSKTHWGKVLTDTINYRYDIKGREETEYKNGNMSQTISYDKYRNPLSVLEYYGDQQKLTEYEYTYDKQGNILTQIIYGTYNALDKDFKKEYRKMQKTEYTYNENGRVVKSVETSIKPVPTGIKGDKIEAEMRADKSITLVFTYDEAGNDTENGKFIFEYDRHSNWYIKWSKQHAVAERRYKYFGAADFENPNENYEEYYEEEG